MPDDLFLDPGRALNHELAQRLDDDLREVTRMNQKTRERLEASRARIAATDHLLRICRRQFVE